MQESFYGFNKGVGRPAQGRLMSTRSAFIVWVILMAAMLFGMVKYSEYTQDVAQSLVTVSDSVTPPRVEYIEG